MTCRGRTGTGSTAGPADRLQAVGGAIVALDSGLGHMSEYWQGLFDWLNGPVMDAGMISPLDPDLVHITDDLNEAVDIALSGLM